jgi:hypothetical protein
MMPEFNTLSLAVEGYPNRWSVLPGEEVTFHCSARVDSFSVEIARIGAVREVVWQQEKIRGEFHPTPEQAYAEGCNWPATFSLGIPATWRSGFYEVVLRGDGVDGPEAVGHSFIVVRPANPGQESAMLLVLSTNTYNAYNKFGGHCLYTGATRVSFARPLERGYVTKPIDPDGFDGRNANVSPDPDPEHGRLQAYLRKHRLPLWSASAGWHNWERRFVKWAEGAGYRFDYAINSDLHFQPEILHPYRLMVSVGHDEYWSWEMRDRVDAFVEGGGNIAFFSGNCIYWQVRYDDDGRTLVCYKYAAREQDPVAATDRQHLLTSIWSDPWIGRPENLTHGLSFCRGGYIRFGKAVPRASGAYTVYRPDHWIFARTGLRYGDALGLGSYIAAYEVDGCAFNLVDGLPAPTHEDSAPAGLTILATTPARLVSNRPENREGITSLSFDLESIGDLEYTSTVLFGDASPEKVARVAHGNAVMAIFTRGPGTVFNAGAADWAYGLDHDPRVQQVTANVLDRLSA